MFCRSSLAPPSLRMRTILYRTSCSELSRIPELHALIVGWKRVCRSEMAEWRDPSAPARSAAGKQVKRETLPKLLNLLSPVVSSWDLFARQIGVPTTQITQIKAANPNTGPSYLYTCFTQALEWWVANHDNPVYESMIRTLDPGIGKVTPVMNRALARELREFMAKQATMCPMAVTGTHTATPGLQAPTAGMDDFTQMNKFMIQGKFASLLEFVQVNLQQRLGGEKVENEFRQFVIRLFHKLPPSFIPISPDVAVIFEAMRSHNLLTYWSFYPLEEVIKHFCEGDSEMTDKMEQYKKDRSGFQLATKIKDYLSVARSLFPYGCDESASELRPKRTPAYLTQLAMILDQRVAEYHLDYLEDLWGSLSSVLSLPPLYVILDAVIMNSILVVWLIPTDMVPGATETAKQNADFFRRYPILKVTIGDECVYSTTEPTVADTNTQVTHRTVSQKHQDLPSQASALEQYTNPKQATNTNERDVLHELGCQLFKTREYRALQIYERNVRTLTWCLCAVLLIYQYLAMAIITLCEDGGFISMFQELENRQAILSDPSAVNESSSAVIEISAGLMKRHIGTSWISVLHALLHSLLLFVLRIGTRVITPVLFISQLDVPAATPQIPKSRLNVSEAIQQILDAYKKLCPRHWERIQAIQSDPSAVIEISAGLMKRHIGTSWISVLHALFFTWLLYYLGAFNMALDKVMMRGICGINFLYTNTIHLPLVNSPISLLVLGEYISILAILLMVGILKEFYLYENQIATYALVLGKEGEELYNTIRKRWGTLDRYCYTTPPILFLLAGLAFFSGRGLTPEPSQEIEAIDLVNWYFWIFILSALTFLATSPNNKLKRCCLIGYVVVAALLHIFRLLHIFGDEQLMIPAVSDCFIFLLYYCHAVLLFNFHVSLLKCHYNHYYHYRQTSSIASICRLVYCLLCLGLLVISVSVTFTVVTSGYLDISVNVTRKFFISVNSYKFVVSNVIVTFLMCMPAFTDSFFCTPCCAQKN